MGYDKIKMKDILRGCLICNINEVYSSKQKNAILQKKERSLELLKTEYKKIETAFENKDNIEKISLSWID